MNNDYIQYPEINFVSTDTETLVNSLIKSYEVFTKRTLYPADPIRLFILWIADIIIQERVIINESAKQNVPRYASDEFLDSLAEIFKDTKRLQAQPAKTTIRFYLTALQSSAQIILKGTRITVDGNIIFETVENLMIKPNELYGDVTAVCQSSGEIGNGFVPGQITQIIDLYPFYDRVENITASENGTDIESDKSFYERLRGSMETFSTTGSIASYIYWVKTASVKITDVNPSSPVPGVVDIRVLLENGELPDAEMIQTIHNELKDKIPLTDKVIISEPDTHLFKIDLIYYIPQNGADSAVLIKQNAEKAIEAYIKWQTEKMGRDINPDELRYYLKAAGVKRIKINEPDFEIVKENEVAVLLSLNAIFGGIENE